MGIRIASIGRKADKLGVNKIETSRIEDLVRSVFATELPFSSVRDGLKVEIAEGSLRVVYSSFELADAPRDHTGIRLHLRLDAGELWICDLQVARPFRLKGVGRRLVQTAEVVASHTRMEVVNLFPLRSSGPFWARLGYVPHGITARVLSKPFTLSPERIVEEPEADVLEAKLVEGTL